jgi:hypothetical protein
MNGLPHVTATGLYTTSGDTSNRYSTGLDPLWGDLQELLLLNKKRLTLGTASGAFNPQ